jgi:hypothetical protein
VVAWPRLPIVLAADESGLPELEHDFGPTLPVLLRQRLGVPERITVCVAIALVLAGILALVLRPGAERFEQLVYRGEAPFNLLYSDGALQRVPPRDGELVRIEGRRPGLLVSVAVSPLKLPPYAGNVVHGLLPAYASGYTRRLRRLHDRLLVHDEGKARVNDAQGYQVGFAAGGPGHLTYGRDVVLVPAESGVRDALLLSLRQEISGPLNGRARRTIDLAKKAFRSFRFGTGRG